MLRLLCRRGGCRLISGLVSNLISGLMTNLTSGLMTNLIAGLISNLTSGLIAATLILLFILFGLFFQTAFLNGDG